MVRRVRELNKELRVSYNTFSISTSCVNMLFSVTCLLLTGASSTFAQGTVPVSEDADEFTFLPDMHDQEQVQVSSVSINYC